MSKVLLEIPTYSGAIEPETLESLWALDRGGHDVDLKVRNGYGVAMARNRIANHSVEGGYDWLLMVDADVTLPQDALVNLMEHDADVCMGFYRNRWAGEKNPVTTLYKLGGWDERYTVEELRDLRESGTHTLRVLGGGMGCCLIRPSVFERMEFPWFCWEDVTPSSSCGEDVGFCVRCAELGIHVCADTRVACGHKFRRVMGAE